MQKKKIQKPDWDQYLGDKPKRYVSYHEGARMTKMPFYRFTRLARQAKANIKIRKQAIVDMEVFEEYYRTHLMTVEEKNGIQEEKD